MAILKRLELIITRSKQPKLQATRLQTGNPKAFTLQSKDAPSPATTNQSKRPFSSPTDVTQGSEISRMKDLNIETDQDSIMDEETEQEPQPKRPAIGEGESPSSSMRARDSQSPPRRSKARPTSAGYSKKIDNFDFKRDSKASPAQQQSIRPAPAGRRIWNPDTDALPKQNMESPGNRGPKANSKGLARRDRRPHQSAGQNLTSEFVFLANVR